MTTHRTIYTGSAGRPFGHVPGHSYLDADIALSYSRCGWRCVLTITRGSAQGYDEEHGRDEHTGHGDTPYAACRDAMGQIDPERDEAIGYARTATSEALIAVEEAQS